MWRASLILGIFSFCFFACATSASSVIVGDSYNEKTDMTSFFISTGADLTFPGKWTRTGYNQSSRQYWFKKDSSSLAIAVNSQTKYPFYDPSQSPFDFVNAFYKWDSEYLRTEFNAIVQTLESDSASCFIIFTVEAKDVDNVFLFGNREGLCFNLMISARLPKSERATLLKSIYLGAK